MERFIDPVNRQSVKDVLETALATGEGVFAYEVPLYTKDHRKRVIWLSASPLRDEVGNISGVAGIGTDVSKIKWKETEFTRFTES